MICTFTIIFQTFVQRYSLVCELSQSVRLLVQFSEATATAQLDRLIPLLSLHVEGNQFTDRSVSHPVKIGGFQR